MQSLVSRRRLVQISSLGLSAVAFGIPLNAAAQDDNVPATGNGTYPGLDSMAGLQSVLARSYMSEGAASALFATPTPGEPAWLGLLALTIATFDSEDNARASQPAFQTILEEHTAMTLADTPAASLDGIDDDEGLAMAKHFADLGVGFGENMWSGGALVRFDTSLVMAVGTGFGNPPIEDAWDQVLQTMIFVRDTPAGDGDLTYAYDGTSAGGDWDRFPDAGDPVLGDVAAPSIYGPTDTALFPEFLSF